MRLPSLAVQLALAATAAFMFSGCATPRVNPADPGQVSGKLMVFWVGEDRFVYYPYHRDPLIYKLPAEISAQLGTEAIRPGAIYTDGGSIPRAVRNVVGFSPWGYGPAYIVHDWLFVAHHCIMHDAVDKHDPRDHSEVNIVRKVDFALSADLLAGTIQALENQNKVPKRPLAPAAIYSGVDSIVARRIWDNPDPRSCDPVEQAVIKNIEAILQPGAMRAAPPELSGPPPVLVYQQDF